MPKFIDYHAQMPPMSPEIAEQMKAWIRSGQPDQFGVKPLGVFVSTTGPGWCLSEAPNADAVCSAHEAKGFTLPRGDVHEVVTLP